MNRPTVIRPGDTGEAVRDLQERLAALGHSTPGSELGRFGTGTTSVLSAFQEARGLRVDGICGPETWASLVESGYALGDRLLYLRQPLLRGDDVAELQGRLDVLGFDPGRQDGIFGDRTDAALRDFQVNAGIAPDGVCGPSTRAALERLGSLADGAVATVREREALRRGSHRLAGRRVYLVAEPGFEALADAVSRGLVSAGTHLVVDTSGNDDSLLVDEANRWNADLFLALRAGDQAGCRCTYYATRTFRSEAGFLLATRLAEALATVLVPPATVCGRSYTALRETRMAAVVCELAGPGDIPARGEIVARAPDVARAVVDGVRRGVEEPLDAAL